MVVRLLDRVGDRDGQEGGAGLLGLGEDRADDGFRQARANRVVNGDEFDFFFDLCQRVGHRFETLGAASDDLHIHEHEVGLVAAPK